MSPLLRALPHHNVPSPSLGRPKLLPPFHGPRRRWWVRLLALYAHTIQMLTSKPCLSIGRNRGRFSKCQSSFHEAPLDVCGDWHEEMRLRNPPLAVQQKFHIHPKITCWAICTLPQKFPSAEKTAGVWVWKCHFRLCWLSPTEREAHESSWQFLSGS